MPYLERFQCLNVFMNYENVELLLNRNYIIPED
jgi:hypothetical protein